MRDKEREGFSQNIQWLFLTYLTKSVFKDKWNSLTLSLSVRVRGRLFILMYFLIKQVFGSNIMNACQWQLSKVHILHPRQQYYECLLFFSVKSPVTNYSAFFQNPYLGSEPSFLTRVPVEFRSPASVSTSSSSIAGSCLKGEDFPL